MSQTVLIPYEGDPFKRFCLSAEASAFLEQQISLSGNKRAIAALFVEQQVRQKAYWSMDVRSSEEEIVAAADKSVISIDQIRRAVLDVLDEGRYARRQFISDLIATGGDVDLIADLYDRRCEWEQNNPSLIFEDDDASPYKSHMGQVFEKVFDLAREGDEVALSVLKALLRDFRNVSSSQVKAWFARKLANSLPDDLMTEMARETIRSNPNAFDAFVDRFVGDTKAGINGLTQRIAGYLQS